MKNSFLTLYGQVMAFYEALVELGEYLPRAYYPDCSDEEDCMEEAYVPDDLFGIEFRKARYQFKYQYEAVKNLREALEKFTSLLNSEYCRVARKHYYDFLSYKATREKAIKAFDAFCEISKNPDSIGWIEKYIYRALERIDINYSICLADGDEVDQLIYAMQLAMGDAMREFLDDPRKAYGYMKLISKIEACPEGPGVVKALELAFDATPANEEKT